MATLVKQGHGNEQHHFDSAALLLVLFTAEMNGWHHTGSDWRNYNREDSENLCETLKQAAIEIEESIPPVCKDDDFICDDCLFDLIIKRHIVELTNNFLGLCAGQPFRIEYNN